MASKRNPKPDPTPAERAEADRAIREFIAAQDAVPESERRFVTSDKFHGPVGQPGVPADPVTPS